MRESSKITPRLRFPGVVVFMILLFFSTVTVSSLPVDRETQSIEPSEIEAVVDKILSPQMDASHVLGAAVSVVQNGKVILSKGYGYADANKQVPVRADRTVFRIGSISKVITWTAVMQLVDQGRLDLNRDVNEYLDFQIPKTFNEPITLNHLMAHTAGFEDRYFAQMAVSPETITPLGEWLRTYIPSRVRLPGQYTAYSNYGAALAGYIVERVSGLPFEVYVEKHIFTPLKMGSSTARQPRQGTSISDLSNGFDFVNGIYLPQAFEVLNVSPAGAMSSTASDMARFMLAHLQAGQLEGVGILDKTTIELMHSQSFTHDPRIPGWSHGWMQIDANGQRAIGHAGDTGFFHSFLLMVPDQQLGIFITTNSVGGTEITIPFIQSMIKKFVTPSDLSSPKVEFERTNLDRLVGSYRPNRMSYSTPEKLLALMSSVEVRAIEQGLVVNFGMGEQIFTEIEPLVFRQVDDQALLVFQEDQAGNIGHSFFSLFPHMALEKVSWYESPAFNLSLLGSTLVVFLSFLLTRFVQIFSPRAKALKSGLKFFDRLPSRVATLIGGIGVSVVVLSVLMFQSFSDLLTSTVGLFPVVRILSIFFVVTTQACVFLGIHVWLMRQGSLLFRIHYTLVAFSAIGFSWFLFSWNLLSSNF